MYPPRLLAHPLTEAGALPLSPLAIATVVLLLTAAATAVRVPPVEPEAVEGPERPGWSGVWLLVRGAGLALLVLVIVTGRLGVNRSTANLAPVLAVGVAWPGLILLSAAAGDVWRRLNPFDTLAWLLGRDREAPGDPAARGVHLALPAALVLAWYLAAFPGSLRPRAVGAALALYTLYTLTGCLVAGRHEWLGRAEIFGLFFGWVARIRRQRLLTWDPPAGAELVLGVLGGGLLFGALRVSALWVPIWAALHAWQPETLALVAFAAVGALLVGVAVRGAGRRGGGAVVTAAAVPVVAALAVALSLLGGRFPTALQLLPVVASDPFGFGWDLFGTSGWRVNPNPLGVTLHITVQVLILAAGGILGARIARRRSEQLPPQAARIVRAIAFAVVGLFVVGGVLAVTTV
jgi:hypothetical protein